jgi:type IV pilus assembly protein PilY1
MMKNYLRSVIALILFYASNVLAVPADIANIPLYLAQPVGVNFLTTIDDSGSMDWEWLPDNLASPNLLRGSANTYNPLAYRPLSSTDSYVLPPWPDAAGTNWGTMNLPPFNAAFNDGFANQTSSNTNGTFAGAGGGGNTYAPNSTSNLGTSFQFAARTSNVRAFYSVYDPAQTSAVCPTPSASLDQCYVKVTLNDNGSKTFTRRQTAGCTNNADLNCYTVAVNAPPGVDATVNENQNFAIWYSYYRKRILMAKAAALRSLATLPTNTRLACHVLNASGNASTTCSKNIDILKEFSGANQLALFAKIAAISTGNSTPTKDAFGRVGAYFTKTGVNSPWSLVPGTTQAPQLACRKAFHMALTDGYYNSNSQVQPPIDTADNSSVTLPDGKNYSATQAPYAGADSQTLADIAFHYWKTNLNPSVASNKVPENIRFKDANPAIQYWNPRNDPATWPHLVNYTVALGLSGTIAKNDANLNNLINGSLNWPKPMDNDPTAIDDLWHAAINSRGDFYSAARAGDLVKAFSDVVGEIAKAAGSAGGISVPGAVTSGNGYAYQTKYNSASWTGEIVAYPILTDGSYGTQAWSTADTNKIPAIATRKIQTIVNNKLVPFTSSNLLPLKAKLLGPIITPGVTTIQDLIGSANATDPLTLFVDYLRGDQTNERTSKNGNGFFRARDFLLGDILGSGVLFVNKKNFGYSTLPGVEGSSYEAYVASKADINTTKILVAGANDGMVHFFKADTGEEYFNFVPPSIIDKLYLLARPGYTHRYFVDGQFSEFDYYDGGWKTVVVGSTGLGGTGVMAIDVTNRDSPRVLWHVDATTNTNIGYGIKKVSVVRIQDGVNVGKWYAVFGNGYESTNGQSALFTVPLTDSIAVTPFIQTAVADTLGNNGLSVPAVVRGTNYAYAGDLQGNMWRFEFNLTGPSVSFNGKPLFSAKGPTGTAQPITSQADVFEPAQGGLMVTFGTGRLYKKDDTTDTNVQTFYGVWDKNSAAGSLPITRSNLMQQSITSQNYNNAFARTERTLTNNPFTLASQKGWFLDLNVSGQAATGERVLTTPLLIFGKTVFTTYIPSSTNVSCDADSSSFVMAVDSFSGAVGTTPSFDTNGDGKIDASDFLGAISIAGTVGDASAQVVNKDLALGDYGADCVKDVGCGTGKSTSKCGNLTSAECKCNAGFVQTSRGDGQLICAPEDSCGSGLVSIKASRIGGSSITSICAPANMRKTRMSWREIQ